MARVTRGRIIRVALYRLIYQVGAMDDRLLEKLAMLTLY